MPTVVVGNSTEFNYRHWIEDISDLDRPLVDAMDASGTFESALYWGAEYDERIVVLPTKPNEGFRQFLEQALGVKYQILVPVGSSNIVSKRAIEDPKIIQRIVESCKGETRPRLLCWGPTPWLEDFIDAAASSTNIAPECEYGARGAAALSDQINSKTVNRTLLSLVLGQDDKLSIPRAVPILGSPQPNLVRGYLNFFSGPSILKANQGWGGKASLDIPRADRDQTALLRDHLREHRHQFELGAIVEENVSGDENCVYSVDVYIAPNGGLESWPSVTYVDRLKCVGEQRGKNTIPDRLSRTIENASQTVATALYDIGYRGWFDIDYLLADSRIYPLEINARRTGGTAAVETAKRLFGKNWPSGCIVRTHDQFATKPGVSIDQLLDFFSTLPAQISSDVRAFPITTRGITSSSREHGACAYLVCAETSASLDRADALVNAHLGFD